MNKKFLARPTKKFGLIDAKTLALQKNGSASTDNLLFNNTQKLPEKKKKKVAKKKSVKPTDVYSDDDASRRAPPRVATRPPTCSRCPTVAPGWL